jgi:tetratricopeptide (TPR) repeat protein
MIVSDWKRTLCLCLVLVAWIFPRFAQAEAGADEAARHFERALAHADALEFDAALVEFQKAYELSPHYSVNYNIGLACAASGRALSAVRAFQRYLDEGGAEVPPERRTRVTTLIKTERPKIARLSLDVQPASAKVTLDGKSVSFPPDGLELDPGNHTVLLEAPGRVERSFPV